ASWGSPLWWPAVVSAAGVPALTAIGFAAGAWFPSRFVTPLVTVVMFFGLAFSTQAASGDHSYWQISPLTVGAFDIGAAPGVASDQPLRYPPACSRTPIPVCVNPAYAGFLPAVTATVGPELTEFAGLPGAPARLSQVPLVYRQVSANGIDVSASGPRAAAFVV